MSVISVDLASRRYRDNGIVALCLGHGSVQTDLIKTQSLGLNGKPSVVELACVIAEIAESRGANLILVDGPQGWRANSSGWSDRRLCEGVTHTPGKTGLPGKVKPSSWTSMAVFSIDVFDALSAAGWPRLSSHWDGSRASVETFPTHAWRSLGHPPLPGKNRARDLTPWIDWLRQHYKVVWNADPSHDELQATVAGLSGLQLAKRGLCGAERYGVNPLMEDGIWREGFIISPRAEVLCDN